MCINCRTIKIIVTGITPQGMSVHLEGVYDHAAQAEIIKATTEAVVGRIAQLTMGNAMVLDMPVEQAQSLIGKWIEIVVNREGSGARVKYPECVGRNSALFILSMAYSMVTTSKPVREGVVAVEEECGERREPTDLSGAFLRFDRNTEGRG